VICRKLLLGKFYLNIPDAAKRLFDLDTPQTVFIAAISSDIGMQLAHYYSDAGYHIIGTYRDASHINPAFRDAQNIHLLRCDLTVDQDIVQVVEYMQRKGLVWDRFVSAVGLLSPIGKFVDVPAAEWKKSVTLNSLQQLELLHHLYAVKRPDCTGNVAFLVGGAINRAFANYSAYSLGKVMLVKFCELISDETADLHCVAIGTGWVASKIHLQTLAAGDKAGENLAATQQFVEKGEQGTSVKDIYDLMEWCFARPETRGRNFSVVHDQWRGGGGELSAQLAESPDMFRLRRHGNQHKKSS